ncbi:A/G-specific adenine glycosylase [Fibrella aquatilis]|uniref:Adenine DNA glycosylase n=1 Tax=Fibrella aquatilis TaxID=2817059 RepID=A0A939G6E3_9BACT|nr:A/G-specific adenine glycosylase [Fibrella aquatilis]MBO0930648.1 A/G-specific adenine glycosylase [Fibrella aquatilis]
MKPFAPLFTTNAKTQRFILDWQSDTNASESADVHLRFAPTLERWYDHHRRDLPWRHTTDPYRIWLSEIILQQTRVVQGLPYYLRFVEAYPTLPDLAQADEQALLRLWQGLGYYSRARNLHQTAKHIHTALNGSFPTTYRDLLSLKGIGAYTAAAVASFAYGERVAVVDGNVYRVLARVFGIEEDIMSTGAKKTFAALATRLIAHAIDPATYNQAVMEFGAIQCTPVAPDCLICPLQQQCVAYQTGRQRVLPVKKKKAAVRARFFLYLVFCTHQSGELRVAMHERVGRDIWQNLHEFYLLETDEPKATLSDLSLPTEVNDLAKRGVFHGPAATGRQLLSHQRIEAVFYKIDLPAALSEALPDGFRWYSMQQISQLPKPVLITEYLVSAFA